MASIQELEERISRMEMNLVTRLNEMQMLNYELMRKVDALTDKVNSFRSEWDRKVMAETDADVLLRNVGILS
jgi:hypothetical protein